ncbi:MAG: flippase-like domain-containing protein, partial [Flavobacteriales bacterium]|nr:flippase-like domain-containing protein [Flavobacteriales bacterium]
MKKALIGTLKVVVPLGLGVWLIFYFYNALSEEHKAQLFDAFGRAELGWLVVSVALGVLSHMSRAWRWRYLLDPMGFTPGFWNCYHAVMSGYFMNLLLPRAGEASRAALLYRREKVPFVKGFGSIMAERAVDLVLLGGLFGLTLLLQVDKLDLFR